jgi:antitoxin component of RelBE/YafQ-DinJ toxin-antitoxin module
MAKLTLKVDETVIARAKRYAAQHGTSISGLVEQFLALVSGSATPSNDELPPILARLRREMQGASADPSTYRRYLERKYR